MDGIAVKIGETETVPLSIVGVTVKNAYESVKNLLEDGVLYDIRFDGADGSVLRRFSRSQPVEAWLVAWPVDTDGKRRHDRQAIVCTLGFEPLTVQQASTKTFADYLVAELDALKEADSDV